MWRALGHRRCFGGAAAAVGVANRGCSATVAANTEQRAGEEAAMMDGPVLAAFPRAVPWRGCHLLTGIAAAAVEA